MIDVADRGQIAPHQMLPLSVVGHPFVPPFTTVAVGVGQVILQVRGKLHLGFGMQIEPLLRHLPGNVRPEQAHREE